MQLKPVSQQVVVVFGASSGIGRGAALEFGRRGAKVVVAARSESGLASLVAEIEQIGGQAIAVKADAADFEQVKSVADKAISAYGRLDTWVHAAATAVIGRFMDTTPAEFKRVIEVNLLGQVYGAMISLPHLKAEGGAFISISSVEARRALPLQSAYGSSKHGVSGFLESLRVELMYDKVPVSITEILPSVINTPFYDNARTKIGVKPTSVPPFYSPDIVVDAIMYAAENPVREMTVGDSGRVLDLAQRLVPSLVDSLLAVFAIPLQHSKKPKAETDPNNLFEPVESDPAFNRADGEYRDLVIPSFFDWLDKNPLAKPALVASVGAATLLLTQALNGDRRR